MWNGFYRAQRRRSAVVLRNPVRTTNLRSTVVALDGSAESV